MLTAGLLPDRAAFRSIHQRKLGILLEAVADANAFYRAKCQIARLDPARLNLDDFVQRFPFTCKHELCEDQRLHPPYGTALTYPLDRYTRCHQTSGSTGAPLRWLDTPASWSQVVDNWVAVLEAAEVSTPDRFFFAFSFGPFLGFWSAFEAAQRRGCFCLPGGAMNSLARLRALLDHRITVLCCTPTYALRLGEIAQAEKVDLSRCQLRLIVTAGEPGGSLPATRARLRTLWPTARVFDHHGMTEVGPVTYECPAQPGVLHVLETAYLAEVIDPGTGLTALPGHNGELVLTTLDRLGSPLLRYRTGDVVKPASAGPCVCGRHELALAGGILGRTDDMVIVRGVNLYPGAVENIIRQFAQVAEYQVKLSADAAQTELSIQVEPAPGCVDPGSLAQQVELALHTAFSLRIPVMPVAVGALPRFEMKARRWRRV